MPETGVTLSPVEQSTLKKAAFGAVHLVSIAYPSVIATTKINVTGAKVLTGATGLVGRILSQSGKADLKGTTDQIADEVLPALMSTIAILKAKNADEAENFRTVVTTAVRQAASSAGDNPARTLMIDKITAALADQPE